MLKQTLQRGFTLIELLVVIAIIGILASVVLASLNDARDNANDASAKTSINNVRAVAEIYYSENSFTYGVNDGAFNGSGVWTATAPSMCAQANVEELMEAGQLQTGNNTGICIANDEAYAVQQQLRSGRFYCVDSTGFAGETAASSIAAGDAVCGP